VTTIFVYYVCECGETVPEDLAVDGQVRCPMCGELLSGADGEGS
jgi:DNA-directed RNA polymerase subunit RPC12/RpoP